MMIMVVMMVMVVVVFVCVLTWSMIYMQVAGEIHSLAWIPHWIKTLAYYHRCWSKGEKKTLVKINQIFIKNHFIKKELLSELKNGIWSKAHWTLIVGTLIASNVFFFPFPLFTLFLPLPFFPSSKISANPPLDLLISSSLSVICNKVTLLTK